MDPEGLFKIQDMNCIIKLFAFNIQERFQELDGLPRNNSYQQSRYMSNQPLDQSEHLIRKYRNYLTSDEKEVKYLQKFVLRIMQILQFFKQRSKSQQILTLAIKKIQQKLTKIVKCAPVDVERLYSHIIDLAKNGFHIKKMPFKDRRLSLKKMDASDQKSNQHQKSVKQYEEEESRNISTAIVNKRRSITTSAKRVIKIQAPKQSIECQIARVYSILQIDQPILVKAMEGKEKMKMQRQLLKQNAIISNAITNYQKNYATYLKKKQKNDNPLKQVNNRSSMRPVINNWISRKRKMSECRKRQPVDSQNVFQI